MRLHGPSFRTVVADADPSSSIRFFLVDARTAEEAISTLRCRASTRRVLAIQCDSETVLVCVTSDSSVADVVLGTELDLRADLSTTRVLASHLDTELVLPVDSSDDDVAALELSTPTPMRVVLTTRRVLPAQVDTEEVP